MSPLCRTSSNKPVLQVKLMTAQLSIRLILLRCRGHRQQVCISGQLQMDAAVGADDAMQGSSGTLTCSKHVHGAGPSFSMSAMTQLPASLWRYNHEWALKVCQCASGANAEIALYGVTGSQSHCSAGSMHAYEH